MADADLLFRIKADASQAKTELAGFSKTVDNEVKKALGGVVRGAGVSGTLSNATSAFIQESQRAIAQAQSVAAGADRAIQRTSSNIAAAQREAASLSSRMGELGRSFATAGAIIGTVGGAIIGAGAAIFAFTKKVADAGSELLTLSQKTGLSVEAIGSLKLIAEDNNSTIQDAARLLAAFSKTVAEAARGSDEARSKLARLGIEPQEALRNLDAALDKAFTTIRNAEPGIKQIGAAQDAFGKSGQNLIPIINDIEGSLKNTIEQNKRLGISFSTDAAKAGDEFGTTLKVLQKQITSVADEVGKNLVPYINREMKGLSNNLKDDQASWKEWSKDTSNAIIGVTEALKAYWAVAQYTSILGVGVKIAQSIGGVMAPPTQLPSPTTPPGFRRGPGGRLIPLKPGEGPTDYITGKGPVYDVDKNLAAEEAAAKKAAEEAERQRKAESDARLANIKTEREKAKRLYQEIIDDEKTATEDRIKAREGLTKALIFFNQLEAKEIAIQEEYKAKQNARQKALEEEGARIVSEGGKEKAAIRKKEREKEEREQREENQRWIAHLNRLVGFNTQVYADTIQDVRDAMEARTLTISEGFDHIERLTLRRYEDELHALTEARNMQVITETEYADALLEIQYRYTRAIQDEVRKRIEARQREVILSSDVPIQTTDTDAREIWEQIGEAPPPDLSGWKIAFTELKQIGLDAFQSLAQGMGSMIESWVLLGDESGASMKKLVATVLAGVAAQSAVLAIFELAKGFASLFFNPAEAAAHFTAAALFGSIAAVSAIAGRAIAGDAFKNNARDERGIPNESRLATADRPQPIDVGRRTGEAGGVLTINLGLKEGIVAEHFKRDYSLNGVTRLIIQTDGAVT